MDKSVVFSHLPEEWGKAGVVIPPDDMEDEIFAIARKRIAEFTLPDKLMTTKCKNDKWRIVSTMQKAIRHGDVPMAMHMANACMCIEPKYLWRRLGVCSIEDVGLGNLSTIMIVLASMGNASFRREIGEQRLAVWLAGRLAAGCKDRLACEFLVWTEYDLALAEKKELWAILPDDDLVALINNNDLPLVERVLATWLLAGTKKYWGSTVPKTNDRPRKRLMQLFLEWKMPPAIYYVAEMVARRIVEGMFVSLLWQWFLLNRADSVDYRELPLPPAKKIGPLNAAGYDMHTQEGKIAINKFFRETPSLLEFLPYARTPEHEAKMKNRGIFVAESGVLAKRLVYSSSESYYDIAHKHELLETGLPVDKHTAFLNEIVSNIDHLHECRRRVVWARHNKR
jgi:hypothetical protein